MGNNTHLLNKYEMLWNNQNVRKSLIIVENDLFAIYSFAEVLLYHKKNCLALRKTITVAEKNSVLLNRIWTNRLQL